MDSSSTGEGTIQPTGQPRRTSPWVYLAVGCSVLLVMCLLVIGAVTVWGYRAIKSQVTENLDPVARGENVKKVLGCKGELPEGYHAFLKFSLPWIMDMVILSDQEPDPDHKEKPFEKRGFIYIKTIRGRNDKKVRDYFEGKADAGKILERGSINMTSGEEIGRGSLTMDDYTTYYTSHEGSIRIKGDKVEGVTTLFFIDCANDQKFRLGVWFGPSAHEAHRAGTERGESGAEREPAQGDEEGEWGRDQARSVEGSETGAGSGPDAIATKKAGPEYAGTPADENAMREFLAHFSPCETSE